MRILLALVAILSCLGSQAQIQTYPLKGHLRVFGDLRLSGLNVGQGKMLIDTTGNGKVNFWTLQDSMSSATSGDTTWIIYRPVLYGYGGVTRLDSVMIISGGDGSLTSARNGLTVVNDTILMGGVLTQTTSIENNGFLFQHTVSPEWFWKNGPDLLGSGRGGVQTQWNSGPLTLASGAAEFATGVRAISRFVGNGDTAVMELREQFYFNAAFRDTRRQVSLQVDSFDVEIRYFESVNNDTAVVASFGRTATTLEGQTNTVKSHIRLSTASRLDTVESEVFVFTDSIVMVSDQGPGTTPFTAQLNSKAGTWSVTGGNLEYIQLEDSAFYVGIRDVTTDTTNWKPAVFNAATDEFVAMSSWPDFTTLSGDSLYGAQTDTTIQIILRVGARKDTVSISNEPAFSVLSVGSDTVYCQLFSYAPVDLSSIVAVVLPPSGPFQPGDWFGVSDIYANASANNAVIEFPSGSQKLYNVSTNDTLLVDGATRTYIFMDNTTEWAIQD